MAGTWALLSRMGEKKIEQWRDSFQRPADRIDQHLPLGIRVKGIVEIPQVDFILAGDQLRIKHPGISNIVISYGVIYMGPNTFHRFYLSSTTDIYMLQIITDEKKDVRDCKLFMPYDEIYPDDWGFWLDEHDGYIGYNIFQTKDGTGYERIWEDQERSVTLERDDRGNEITRIPPVEFLETVYMDPYGKDTEMVKYSSMLYGRTVNETTTEFLLVSAVEEGQGATVQLMVGVALEPMAIKVL